MALKALMPLATARSPTPGPRASLDARHSDAQRHLLLGHQPRPRAVFRSEQREGLRREGHTQEPLTRV